MSSDPSIAWGAVTIDCLDTGQMAEFWSDLLGTLARPAGDDRPGWWRVGPLVPGGPAINLQPVPEPKAGKSRIHLDLWVADLDDSITRVLSAGGHQLRRVQVLERGRIAVMADPEGNEFCLLAAPE